MDEAEVFAAILAVVAMTLGLVVLLFVELRWHGRLLEEIKEALLKQHGATPPELAPPPSPRVPVEIEAEIVGDSKDEWDRRLAEHEATSTPPTLPSGTSRTPHRS